MTEETPYDVMQDPIVLVAMDLMIDSHRNHALKPDPELGGQRRKYSKAHYEVHPIQVAKMVAKSRDGDAITVAVALLHDVIEDTTRRASHIGAAFAKFGAEVAQDVMHGVIECSDVSELADGNRAFRRNMDKEHAWLASPKRKTVKLADIKSNLPSIVKNDPGFARKWVQEKADVLPGLTEGDPQLFQDVKAMIDKFFARQDVKDPDWELV